MKKLLSILLFVGLVWGSGAWGATYYVSVTDGSDSNNSTQAQSASTPWKHHPDSNLSSSNSQAIRSNLVAGDIIKMKRGDVWYGTILTTQKAGTGATDGGLITTSDYSTGPLPIIASATLYDGAWTDTGANGEFKIACTVQPYIVYNGNTQLTSGTPGSLAANGFGWSTNELYVKIGSDPTGGAIQSAIGTTSANSSALCVNHNYRAYQNLDLRYANGTTAGVVYSVSTTGAKLTTCSISRGRTYGLRGFASIGTIVTGCTITSISGTTSGIAFTNNGSGANVTYNTISGFGTQDIELNTHSGATIGYNTLSSSATGIYCVTSGSHTIYNNTITSAITTNAILLSNSNSSTIYNNTLTSWNTYRYGHTPAPAGYGIKIAGTSSANKAFRNTIDDCYGGVLVNSSAGTGENIIAYNLVRYSKVNPIGIFTSGATADIVANNTILHRPIKGDDGNYHGHGLSIQDAAVKGVFYNNLVISLNLIEGNPATGALTSDFVALGSSSGGYSETSNNNIYYNLSGAYEVYTLNDAGSTTQDYLLSAFKTTIASKITGAESNSTNADPIVVSLTDCSLQQGSPATGAGVFIPGVHDQPAPNNVDAGGQEFNSMAINIGAYGIKDANGNVVARPTLKGMMR